MNKKSKTIIIIIIILILMCGSVFIEFNWNSWFKKDNAISTADIDSNAQNWTGNKNTYTGEKNTNSIDIPGFDVMNIKADTKNQNVNLYNPEKNTCYFKISIFLSNGTKLWESNLVEPGKAIYEITMNQTLSAGEYENCILKYECFKMDEKQTPLNGSEIKFTMNVLK